MGLLYDIILMKPKSEDDLITAANELTNATDASGIGQKKMAALFCALGKGKSLKSAMKEVPLVVELDDLWIYEVKSSIVEDLALVPKSQLKTLCRRWQESTSEFEFEDWEDEFVLSALIRIQGCAKLAVRTKKNMYLAISL